jgi:hypothetical protein
MCECDEFAATSFDPGCLGIATVHPTAMEYFDGAVPEMLIDGPFHCLLGASDLEGYNREGLPCRHILPFGFIGFAMEGDGDAVVVDTTDGHVSLVSHEIYGDDGICSPESGTSIPITRDAILAHAKPLAPSVASFFEAWRDELIGRRNERSAFLAASAADPNVMDKYGNTLLVYAISADELDTVKNELRRGARLEHLNGNGRTPLGDAVVFGRAEIAKHLIACGADVNAAGDRGTTPLMLAARHAQLACMKLLVAAGADRAARDASGKTAADLLCTIHGTAAMKMLLTP